MTLKYSIAAIGYASWCGLGFVRGTQDYAFNYNRFDKNKPYMYIRSFMYGNLGIILYANPILLPIFLYKETYRLEINLRNLENEKNSSFYNELF